MPKKSAFKRERLTISLYIYLENQSNKLSTEDCIGQGTVERKAVFTFPTCDFPATAGILLLPGNNNPAQTWPYAVRKIAKFPSLRAQGVLDPHGCPITPTVVLMV